MIKLNSHSIREVFLILVFMSPQVVLAQYENFYGLWNFDKNMSKNVGAFFESGEMRYYKKIFRDEAKGIVIEDHTVTEAGHKTIRLELNPSGIPTFSIWPKGDLAIFSFEAVAIANDDTVRAVFQGSPDSTSFDTNLYLDVLVSQGNSNVVLNDHYQISKDGKTLTVIETRNSRKQNSPATYVFHRANE
jgi:hypothetical protein